MVYNYLASHASDMWQLMKEAYVVRVGEVYIAIAFIVIIVIMFWTMKKES